MTNHIRMKLNHDITTAIWGEVKQIPEYDWAILPWGATEPHNGHPSGHSGVATA